jgi:ribonuclease J
MLIQHGKMAQKMGIPAENIVITNNGDMVELTENSISVVGQVPSGIELVDRSGIVHHEVLKERQQLAGDGVVTVAAAVSWEGKLLAQPEIHLRGVVASVEKSLLQQLVIKRIERTLSEQWTDFAKSLDGKKHPEVDWTGLQQKIEGDLERLTRRELQSRPLVVFLLQNPEEPPVKRVGRRRQRTAAKAAS